MTTPRLDRTGLAPLYVIADAEALAPRDPSDVVEAIAQAGVEWIQLRAKRWTDAVLYEQAGRCARALEGSPSTLWINDRADLARLLGARALHLGQDDLPPSAARRVLGDEVWIGRSTHDLEQAREAALDPDVDVVAVGPIFTTTSKDRPDPVVGLDLVTEARRLSDKPLVAIGGIGRDTGRAAIDAGADCVAVISAVCSASDLERACRDLLGALGA